MTTEPTFTVRDAIRQILGTDAANGIMRDCGDDWAVTAALAMIEGNGGPRNDIEQSFIEWWDRQSSTQNTESGHDDTQ